MKLPTFNLEVSDSRLKTYLQNEIIGQLPIQKRLMFQNISNCGKKMIKDEHGRTPDVQLMKAEEGNKAKFWGLVACKNTFLCPTCSAYFMSKHAQQIGAAIDALKNEGQAAFMMTLTLIHYKNLECFDLMEILYNAWKSFAGGRNKNDKNDRHTMSRFRYQMNCKYSVKVCEFTYSEKKGWNPHFHCLFWVPKNKLQDVAKWENKLRESWHNCLAHAWAKHFAIKNQNEHPDKKQSEEYLKKAFARLAKFSLIRAKQGNGQDFNRVNSGSLWISKTKKGKIYQAQSSQYINGWGTDKELTGKPRKEASGKWSYTPHQLLESAAAGNIEHKQKFTEFALAVKTKLRRRVMYSQGLHKIIKAWMATNEYQEGYLKKNTPETKWKSLVSFSKEQWNEILHLEQTEKLYIRHNILFLAANYNAEKAFQLIYDYLLFYGIDIKENATNYNFWCDLAEQLFNNNKYGLTA